MLSVLVLRDSGGFHLLEANRVSLCVLDHGLELLRCRVLRVPLWGLAHVFVVDYLFDFLNGKAYHAPANLYSLGAIWLELNVFGFRED